jgi:hypothetical protein
VRQTSVKTRRSSFGAILGHSMLPGTDDGGGLSAFSCARTLRTSSRRLKRIRADTVRPYTRIPLRLKVGGVRIVALSTDTDSVSGGFTTSVDTPTPLGSQGAGNPCEHDDPPGEGNARRCIRKYSDLESPGQECLLKRMSRDSAADRDWNCLRLQRIIKQRAERLQLVFRDRWSSRTTDPVPPRMSGVGTTCAGREQKL